jgi:hypothetical protein
MSLDSRIENPGKTPAEPRYEVHTELGVELVVSNRRWMAWFALSLILVAAVGFFIWVGIAGASAPGGCGGG